MLAPELHYIVSAQHCTFFFFFYINWFICSCMHRPMGIQRVCGGQRTSCRTWFPPSTVRVPRLNSGPQACVASLLSGLASHKTLHVLNIMIALKHTKRIEKTANSCVTIIQAQQLFAVCQSLLVTLFLDGLNITLKFALGENWEEE